ncbi:MAG TPA: hypothetical protein VFW11_19570 [Cyclobacteriaceae bacterium]|nr:hypothetical protein [Cyclobacteriaceae bacterium]
MDNLQFWIYIIIAVIYVISRALKKGSQDGSSSRPSDKDFETPEGGKLPKQLSFEELLREITESKQPKPRPQPTPRPIQKTIPKPKPAFVDYDEDIEEEEKDLEDVNYNYKRQNQANEIYERAKSEAFSRPSLEETLLKEQKDVSYSRFREFSMTGTNRLLDEYIAELRKPSGFKKAIVLSEILNRRF